MKARIGAIVIAAALVLYLVFTAQRGIIMLREPNLVARVLAIALFALPILGAWALIAEFLFGARMQRLAEQLEAEGGLPVDDLPRTPGGRIVRGAADAQFDAYARAVEESPDDWREWFRLSCAYDASGDRRRARRAMRRAIALERRTRS